MKTIKLTPYPRELWLTRSVSEFERNYKRSTGQHFEVPGNAFGAATRISIRGLKGYMILLRSRNASQAVHECSHAALMLADDMGFDPREANGEPFCYLIQHMLAEALKK